LKSSLKSVVPEDVFITPISGSFTDTVTPTSSKSSATANPAGGGGRPLIFRLKVHSFLDGWCSWKYLLEWPLHGSGYNSHHSLNRPNAVSVVDGNKVRSQCCKTGCFHIDAELDAFLPCSNSANCYSKKLAGKRINVLSFPVR
jgi:hypothetical protein